MSKRSGSKKATRGRRGRDAQIQEFEGRDLGDDLRASGAGVVIRPRARPTSIALDADLVEQLRAKGAKRGLGYQTMLKLIVREHLHEY
jgi:uncharacterized protein (DUF4415 family)